MTELPRFDRDDLVGVAIGPGVGLGLACAAQRWAIASTDPLGVLARIHADDGPRWVWWGHEERALVAGAGLPIDRCWDISTIHRFLQGAERSSIGEVWAVLHGLSLDSLPAMGQLDLLAGSLDEGDRAQPVRPDGHLRPEWIAGGFGQSPDRTARWAALVLDAQRIQQSLLADLPDPVRALATARSESGADLLCAEMAVSGLPVDRREAERLITVAAGPRPRTVAEEDQRRAERDDRVLAWLDPGQSVNLRNPGEVNKMLRRQGFDLPDTRAWRLEAMRDREPLIDALLQWRKAERIATTYGWRWLDEHVSGGRLRGGWASSDGAAGRMTASAGLHNLPTTMRSMVAAEPGHRLVRADLGQIEPRVLAAVSGDHGMIEATRQDDLYLPIAQTLNVERDIAKVAVLGAMYGATTGASAGALAGLERGYPVAMALLAEAAESGARRRDVFTSGGRRVRTGVGAAGEGDLDRAISAAAARGRYARNAVIQGSAAEFFKVWAIIVRRRGRPLGAEVVLCLHDELLVHVANDRADETAAMIEMAVDEAAYHWSPRREVRFVVDVSVVDRWSEAK